MRLLALALFFAAAPALAETELSLDLVASEIASSRLPGSVERAPDLIGIDAALRDILLAQTLDGGREQSVFLRFDPGAGRLSFDRSVAGDRYRASGGCDDCDYPQPVRGHTHPYENPFSVVDLIIAGRTNTASVVVGRDGRLWLALPTTASHEIAIEEWREFRYALFGNRLQCPTRTPPGGWASQTGMARNVEAVMRAAAHDLKVVLYVLHPGDTQFRKLADFDHGESMFDIGRPYTRDDLNAYEMTLLRTISLASAARERREGPWLDRGAEIDPRLASPTLDQAFIEPPDPEDPAEIAGAPRQTANLASDAGRYWFRPLPTTVYRWPFGDLSRPTLPFASVQYSADCRSILVLQGEQRFAPDGVAYSRGWRRARNGPGAWNEGWREMRAAEFPAGQVVPW